MKENEAEVSIENQLASRTPTKNKIRA